MTRLLIIDDRDATVQMCHRNLPQFDYVTRCNRTIPCQVCDQREQGCTLKCAHDWTEAREALAAQSTLPDLVALDLHFALPEERLLPEDKSHLPTDEKAHRNAINDLRCRQGLLILEQLRQLYPTLPVVLLTTRGEEMPEPTAVDPLVFFCENEIVDSRSLAAEIARVLRLSHSAQEGPVFWGRAPAMAELRRAVDVMARSPLPVLIEGETGTGKSFLVEQVLHPRSGVKGPLVITDLSTIPPTLLPAHLFGSRRGSFTGSVEDQPGVFEQAHGGTLFLDEIANLDLDLQRQLLLVLERGVVTRLGETRARPARVKLVAATNQDVEALVAAGKFRADLYMRLNPATRLRVPPVRERSEDLPDLLRFAFLEALNSEALRPLVRQFLARFPTPADFAEDAAEVVFAAPSAAKARPDGFTIFLSRRSLSRLVSHAWPGNHREVKLFAINALAFTLIQQLDAPMGPVERAPAVLSIPDARVDQLVRPEKTARTPAAGRSVEVVLKKTDTFAKLSAEVERQYMLAVFKAHNGDLDAVARELLGQSNCGRKVHLRMNQLGLQLRKLRGGGA